MNFLEYKKHLISNDIRLFDFDYRISYKNLFILNENIYQSNQTGGGNKNSLYYISPFNILKNNDKTKVQILVSNLVGNNFNGAKYICQQGLTLRV